MKGACRTLETFNPGAGMPGVTRHFIGRAVASASFAAVLGLAAPPLPPLRTAFIAASWVLAVGAAFLLVVAATGWGFVLGGEHGAGEYDYRDRASIAD